MFAMQLNYIRASNNRLKFLIFHCNLRNARIFWILHDENEENWNKLSSNSAIVQLDTEFPIT